jgi:hypothetical protein
VAVQAGHACACILMLPEIFFSFLVIGLHVMCIFLVFGPVCLWFSGGGLGSNPCVGHVVHIFLQYFQADAETVP